MKSAIHIGAAVNKRSVKQIEKFVLKVLKSNAGDDVKKHAISSFSVAYQVGPSAVSNCNFQMEAPKKEKRHDKGK